MCSGICATYNTFYSTPTLCRIPITTTAHGKKNQYGKQVRSVLENYNRLIFAVKLYKMIVHFL